MTISMTVTSMWLDWLSKPEIYDRAEMNEIIMTAVVTLLIAAICGAVGMVVSRFVKSKDDTDAKLGSQTDRLLDKVSSRVDDLREEVGKLKMINEAQWRNIEEMKSEVRTLRDRVYEVKR